MIHDITEYGLWFNIFANFFNKGQSNLSKGDIAHIQKIFWQNALRSWFLGMHFGPNFGGMEGRRESTIVPFERAIVVSYKLSIVTFVLSLTIRPQFAIECL